MNFPLITIPDPAAVGKWLDEQVPDILHVTHNPTWGAKAWHVIHYADGYHHYCNGATTDDLLADIKSKTEKHDPLAKLRKDAEAHGFALMKLPTD